MFVTPREIANKVRSAGVSKQCSTSGAHDALSGVVHCDGCYTVRRKAGVGGAFTLEVARHRRRVFGPWLNRKRKNTKYAYILPQGNVHDPNLENVERNASTTSCV